jgi:ABC-type dipeptide/oligopeptide/nickel transport system permease component
VTRVARFVALRAIFAVPQIFGISLVTFFIVRLLPGNPAYTLAGAYAGATPEIYKTIQQHLGLDKPIYVQYLIYLRHVLQGDLGVSWFTSSPVTEELSRRFPATLELISAATLIIVVGGIGLGALVGVTNARPLNFLLGLYGHLAGAFPDFWLGLVLAFILFFWLGWVPAPVGQLGISVSSPHRITGMYVVDAALTGDWVAFQSAVTHLIVPAATLVLVYMAPIVKLTRSTVEEMLQSDFARYARACGLPQTVVLRYALRNSLPPAVALIGFTYGYLLGGAVLIENVFSWGGLGSLVVEAISHSDYFVVQGFVLVSALFNLLIYLAVDLIYLWIDPRVSF